MPRLATSGRPPILASLCLLGAVVTLRPAPRVEPAPDSAQVERQLKVIVAGIPRGDLYEPQSAIDPWIFQAPHGGTVAMPNVVPHDLVWHPARALPVDQVVSGFLRLLAGTWT